MTNGNYEEKILEAVHILVENAVTNAKYDKTIKGIVSRCMDETIGKYVIKYQDSAFYAYSNNTDIRFTPGTEVYVLVPGNDMAQEKTIMGSVEKLGPDYISILEGDKKYEVVGKNCIEDNKDSFELCSYKNDQQKILYERDSETNLIQIDTLGFDTYIKTSSAIICGGKIRTSIPAEQRFKGDYGIVFELDFIDNSDGEIVTKSYVVDINQMIGNPYDLKEEKRQYAIFNVDGKNFKSIKRIYIYQKGFSKKDNLKDK